VLVGTRTAAHDNPQLNVREWSGRNPVRIVIDRFLRLPENLLLWDGSQRTLCYNVLKHEDRGVVHFVRLDEADFTHQLIADLHKQNIQSVMIEGGALTLNLFITAGLWDEARIFHSSRSLGAGIAAPIIKGTLSSFTPIFSDELKIFRHGESKH